MTSYDSRIPSFYKLSVQKRIRKLYELDVISRTDYQALSSNSHTLNASTADRMIENVIGVMGLPMGLALNFLINGRDRVIPMVVEEPSIVAALSSTAKLCRLSGGFKATCSNPIMIGQLQVLKVPNCELAKSNLYRESQAILTLANSIHPKMVERGGGAQDIEVFIHNSSSGKMLVLHLLVDTRDAMGANLVNSMCEAVAPLVEKITDGRVLLRILSNLTDRCIVVGRLSIPLANLVSKDFSSEQVRDGIIAACDFAKVDPYRATTHNKGIMNGIDAVAIATGNDWRAIEAAAHAYAAQTGRYSSLTDFCIGPDGELLGRIQIPLKVGIVGGSLQSNPSTMLSMRLLGVKSATELAEIMACVGLAQNFAALKALSTEGIQRGHMNLHARSVATVAGASPKNFAKVVKLLIESADIKVRKAKEIIQQLHADSDSGVANKEQQEDATTAYGKIILLGEHAVVYGSRVLAFRLPLTVTAKVTATQKSEIELSIPQWDVKQTLPLGENTKVTTHSFQPLLEVILKKFALSDKSMRIEVQSQVPRAVGLGGSAAVIVAIIRAINQCYNLDLDTEQINETAFECEKISHTTPSGIDNTIATYGRNICYKRNQGEAGIMQDLVLPCSLPLVIGFTGTESFTSVAVNKVRQAWQTNPSFHESIFKQIDYLVGQALMALEKGDLGKLGTLMNLGHGCLNALQVSSPEIEQMLQIFRNSGALGAKLTGSGIGGSVIALCESVSASVSVAEQIRVSGYEAIEIELS